MSSDKTVINLLLISNVKVISDIRTICSNKIPFILITWTATVIRIYKRNMVRYWIVSDLPTHVRREIA